MEATNGIETVLLECRLVFLIAPSPLPTIPTHRTKEPQPRLRFHCSTACATVQLCLEDMKDERLAPYILGCIESFAHDTHALNDRAAAATRKLLIVQPFAFGQPASAVYHAAKTKMPIEIVEIVEGMNHGTTKSPSIQIAQPTVVVRPAMLSSIGPSSFLGVRR